MRILVVTHRFPYPPNKGEKIRGFHWLRALSERYIVDLLSLTDEYIPDEYISKIEEFVSRLYIVRLSRFTFPVRAFYSFFVSEPLTVAAFYSPSFKKILKGIIKEYDLSIAICSSTAWYLKEIYTEGIGLPPLIVDFVDFDSHKWLSYSLSERIGRLKRFLYSREAGTLFKLERSLAYLARKSIFISPYEAGLSGFDNVLVVPNPIVESWFKERNSFDDIYPIDKLLFFGQMDYLPNVDACLWFAENVWPSIRMLYPHLRWYIVGRAPAREIKRLASDSRIIITGSVDSIQPYIRSSISIVPLRMVFGMQNKVLQSMASAIPTIVSVDVAEKMGLRSTVEVANSAEEWTGRIRRIIEDKGYTYKLIQRGLEVVSQRFSPAFVYQRMIAVAKEVAGIEESEQVDNLLLSELLSEGYDKGGRKDLVGAV